MLDKDEEHCCENDDSAASGANVAAAIASTCAGDEGDRRESEQI